jgi:cation transport protein ChaC
MLLHPPHRDPQRMLGQTLREWGGQDDLWVFAYGSLIWNPEFSPVQRCRATLYGWHRALRMWSRINRGTPEQPGLVLALLPGGACKGVALRIARHEVPQTLTRLWDREMITGVYDPRFVRVHPFDGQHGGGGAEEQGIGTVKALAFTLSRKSPSFTGPLGDQQLRHIMRHACGRYGTTCEYVEKTVRCLQEEGIHDRALEQLARRHGTMGV